MNKDKEDKTTLNDETILKAVKNILSDFDIEWKTVLSLRFGLNGEPPKTVKEVAKILGTSKEAIMSLEANALRALYTKKQ